MKVITDREVQLAREHAHEAGDDRLADMLQQLLDFREHGRIAVWSTTSASTTTVESRG